MRISAVFVGIALAACSPEDRTDDVAGVNDQSHNSGDQQRSVAEIEMASAGEPIESDSGALQQQFEGPGMVCGDAFVIVLAAGETLTRNDPRQDFLTYRVDGDEGSFVLYEGNYPQSSDEIVQTGRDWPSVIAVHDNRAENGRQPIAGRLLISPEAISQCRRASR